MKKLLILLSLVSQVSWAESGFRQFDRVSLEDQFEVNVVIDEGSVRCSHIGYSLEELKISIPDLRRFTVFDHANFGESEPCMTAGACGNDWMDGFSIDDLIQGNPGVERMKIDRVLTESFSLDFEAQSCGRFLIENINGKLRGIEFRHTVHKRIGGLPLEVCLQIEKSENL